MLAFFCLGARYRPWQYFAALHSRVFGDGAAPRRTRCSPQPRQHSVFRASDGETFSKFCLRRRFFCGESGSCLVRGESKRSPMARSSRMRSRATGSGNILARCVPGRSTMAKCSRDAFPSVRRWRDCALMRPWPDWQWQYSCAVRSRASIRGKIPPRCVLGRQSVASFAPHASQKWSRTGKSPVRGKIRAPCIRKRAPFGKICAPCIRKAPQTAFRERTARRSCHEGGLFCCTGPSNHARREDLAVRRSAKPPERPQPRCRRTARAARARSPGPRNTAREAAPPSPPGQQVPPAAPSVPPLLFANTSK